MNIYGREGETDFSSISLYMDPRVPGAPTNVTATAGDTQVTVTWTAPISDDEPAVTGYTVTVNPGGHVEDVDDSILTATVTGLVVGTDYSVTVTARNRLGDSDPSDPRSITTTAVPGAPTIVSASGGDAHVTLTWTAPTSDGGSAIIGYMVTVNPGDHEEYVDGSTLTATVTGLAVGTEYTVRVIARNLLGDSDSSDPRSITTAIPGARTNLTNNLTSDLTPAWSPDGSQIAFSSLRTDWPNYEIYVMNADGTGQTRLTHNFAWDSSPAWSPDGLQIAFESSRDSAQGTGREEIYVMNADGTGQTNLTNNPLSAERYPTWSPDGSQIAFASNRDGYFEIYVMDADGNN
jgi:hypothetical protein